jgi:hypothetical protein
MRACGAWSGSCRPRWLIGSGPGGGAVGGPAASGRENPCRGRVDVTPDGQQALYLVLHATNGPAGRTPGPFTSQARTPRPPGSAAGASTCLIVTPSALVAFLPSVDGQVLLVHNRTRPYRYPKGWPSARRLGWIACPAWSGLRPREPCGAPGVVARSDGDAFPGRTGRAAVCSGFVAGGCGYIVQQSGWPSALGASCPHRSVPAMTPEARRRRLRGRGPVGWSCSPTRDRIARPGTARRCWAMSRAAG